MAHKGHPMSAATRAKISAALKGRKHARRKGGHHKGHPVSAATRAKLSAALRGKHHKGHHVSAATRAKISAALKGKHHQGHHVSAATRAKISAALRARHPNTKHAPVHHRGHGVRHGVPHKVRTIHHVTVRTSKRRHHRAGRSLISSATHHTYRGFLKQGIRHKRTRIVIHRTTRAHRVWRRRKRR